MEPEDPAKDPRSLAIPSSVQGEVADGTFQIGWQVLLLVKNQVADGTFQIGWQVLLLVKNPPASAGDTRDCGSSPRSGKSLGEKHGDPLQYSCLENPMDRGAWWATVHGVPESQTGLK